MSPRHEEQPWEVWGRMLRGDAPKTLRWEELVLLKNGRKLLARTGGEREGAEEW